jgi:hypothetical protein
MIEWTGFNWYKILTNVNFERCCWFLKRNNYLASWVITNSPRTMLYVVSKKASLCLHKYRFVSQEQTFEIILYMRGFSLQKNKVLVCVETLLLDSKCEKDKSICGFKSFPYLLDPWTLFSYKKMTSLSEFASQIEGRGVWFSYGRTESLCLLLHFC